MHKWSVWAWVFLRSLLVRHEVRQVYYLPRAENSDLGCTVLLLHFISYLGLFARFCGKRRRGDSNLCPEQISLPRHSKMVSNIRNALCHWQQQSILSLHHHRHPQTGMTLCIEEKSLVPTSIYTSPWNFVEFSRGILKRDGETILVWVPKLSLRSSISTAWPKDCSWSTESRTDGCIALTPLSWSVCLKIIQDSKWHSRCSTTRDKTGYWERARTEWNSRNYGIQMWMESKGFHNPPKHIPIPKPVPFRESE